MEIFLIKNKMTTSPFPHKFEDFHFDNNGFSGVIDILKFSNCIFIRINDKGNAGMGNIVDISSSVTPRNLIGESCNNILLLSLSSIIQEFIIVLSNKYDNSLKCGYIIESNLSNDYISNLFFKNNNENMNEIKKYIEMNLYKQ